MNKPRGFSRRDFLKTGATATVLATGVPQLLQGLGVLAEQLIPLKNAASPLLLVLQGVVQAKSAGDSAKKLACSAFDQDMKPVAQQLAGEAAQSFVAVCDKNPDARELLDLLLNAQLPIRRAIVLKEAGLVVQHGDLFASPQVEAAQQIHAELTANTAPSLEVICQAEDKLQPVLLSARSFSGFFTTAIRETQLLQAQLVPKCKEVLTDLGVDSNTAEAVVTAMEKSQALVARGSATLADSTAMSNMMGKQIDTAVTIGTRLTRETHALATKHTEMLRADRRRSTRRRSSQTKEEDNSAISLDEFIHMMGDNPEVITAIGRDIDPITFAHCYGVRLPDKPSEKQK